MSTTLLKQRRRDPPIDPIPACPSTSVQVEGVAGGRERVDRHARRRAVERCFGRAKRRREQGIRIRELHEDWHAHPIDARQRLDLTNWMIPSAACRTSAMKALPLVRL